MQYTIDQFTTGVYDPSQPRVFGGAFAYHPYPSVNYNLNTSGQLTNTSYNYSFPSWLKTSVDSGTYYSPYNGLPSGSFHSGITEFGWNPGQMRGCFTHQYDKWSQTQSNSNCRPNDSSDNKLDLNDHYFGKDISNFLNSPERRGAEVILTWNERYPNKDDWTSQGDLANGIGDNGMPRKWFVCYQQWPTVVSACTQAG